ncbi:hypothetical protein RGQ29_017810 [Quercus rubra]|uniref:Uncharacterized protein n=1 Tax=Quercus rubra TaxID=3512 RepID=A0AAN7IY96_QUERU|nr:hypothetical protein RGQ29_017810 [Quercus rubra]
MQQSLKGKEDEEEEKEIWDCGSPLYDSYELASLSHIIDRHLMALPHLGLGGCGLRSNNVVVMVSESINREEKNSSTGSGCVMNMMWKRKVTIGGRRNEKPQKIKTWISSFFKRIGSWKI